MARFRVNFSGVFSVGFIQQPPDDRLRIVLERVLIRRKAPESEHRRGREWRTCFRSPPARHRQDSLKCPGPARCRRWHTPPHGLLRFPSPSLGNLARYTTGTRVRNRPAKRHRSMNYVWDIPGLGGPDRRAAPHEQTPARGRRRGLPAQANGSKGQPASPLWSDIPPTGGQTGRISRGRGDRPPYTSSLIRFVTPPTRSRARSSGGPRRYTEAVVSRGLARHSHHPSGSVPVGLMAHCGTTASAPRTVWDRYLCDGSAERPGCGEPGPGIDAG